MDDEHIAVGILSTLISFLLVRADKPYYPIDVAWVVAFTGGAIVAVVCYGIDLWLKPPRKRK